MSGYKLKPGKIGDAVTGSYKNVKEKFTNAFLEKDEGNPSGYTLKTGEMAKKPVAAYQKIEDTVVGGYKKVEDAFVEAFLEKEEDSGDAEQEQESEKKLPFSG